MTLPDPKLHVPLAFLLASSLLGSAIFQLSLNTRMTADSRFIAERSYAEQAALALREAPARLLQDQTETELHKRIRSSGFLGPENRVGWISALAQAQVDLNLTGLSWHLSPQVPSALAPDLNVSNMVFSASPLDQGKLTKLIERLHATAPGRFSVEHCALSLDSDSGQANCRLNWWTLVQDAQ